MPRSWPSGSRPTCRSWASTSARDRRKIRSGREWDDEIEAGLRTSQLVVAVLTPHAVREESVCRDELAFARFACKLPIVPALAEPCEPPFVIFRLDYIDLTAWRDSPDRYKLGFKRLLDAIQAHFRGEPPRYRRWDDRFPQFDFGPFLYDKRRDFCGREWLFQRIDAWRADRDRHRALLITGDPGIGKSAIVAQLVHMNPGAQVLAYHCCRADTPETLRPGRFIRGLAGMIASQLEGYASQLDDPQVEAALGEARCETDPASALEEGILNPLHRVPTPAGGARYILIDACSTRHSRYATGCRSSRCCLPPGSTACPAGCGSSPQPGRSPTSCAALSGLRAEEIRADEPHNLDDIERFLAHRLGQPGLHGSFAGEPCFRGGSHPPLAREERRQLPLDRAGAPGSGSGHARLRPSRRPADRPDRAVHGVLRAALPRRLLLRPRTAGAGGRDCRPRAADPAEIAAVTGLDLDYALPPLLDRLAAYLPERDGRRAVFHKSFADWLTETQDPRPAGRFFVSPRRGHERLADWCWAEYRRGAEKMSPYALRHLPAQLVEAARWDDLGTLLRGLPFLEAKAEAGYVFDLAMDFTRAIEAMPGDHAARRHLRLIEQALRSDLHFLARHPTSALPVSLESVLVVRLSGGSRPPRPAPRRLARGWAALEPTRGRSAGDLTRILARRSNEEPRPSPGCGRSARPRFLSAAPSWPASAGTTIRSRAWRSTGRVGGSSAGRTTTRCGSGTRPPAPSWPASAGTTAGS